MALAYITRRGKKYQWGEIEKIEEKFNKNSKRLTTIKKQIIKEVKKIGKKNL